MISPPEIVQAPDSRTVDYRVREALGFMEDHFAEPLTVAGIARHVGIGGDRLEHLFRRDTGHAPMRALRIVRMRAADRLLADGRLTVKEVGAATGFRDVSHFVRDFSAHYGLSPDERRHTRGTSGETVGPGPIPGRQSR